MHITSTSS